jgi:hypothetical protein
MESAMSLTNLLGYAAGFLVLLTFSMKTMVPLRVVGIFSNVFFITYAFYASAQPIMVLHSILLPLNIFRLVQILVLLRKVEEASQNQDEPNLDWLKSIAQSRALKATEILFRKGEEADRMFYVMSGLFRVSEIGVELGRGQIVGELALLAPGKKRSQSVECVADGEVLEISYDKVRQLYFQSPKFGFFFLQLATRRLFENLERQDRELETYRVRAKS